MSKYQPGKPPPKPNGRKLRAKKLSNPKTKMVPKHLADEEFMSEVQIARREMFAQAYVKYGVQQKAAEEAGYTGAAATLKTLGWRLLQEPAVKARVAAIRANCMLKLQISTDDVLAEYARIAFGDIRKAFNKDGTLKNMADLDDDTARVIAGYEITEKSFGDDGSSVERKLRMWDKQTALAQLSKHLGLFKSADDRKSISPEEFLEAMLAARERVLMMRTVPALSHEPANS